MQDEVVCLEVHTLCLSFPIVPETVDLLILVLLTLMPTRNPMHKAAMMLRATNILLLVFIIHF